MSQESFNPSNPGYKKVEDLPEGQQANFKNVEGGFVKNTALEDIAEVQSDEEYLMEVPEDTERDNRVEQWEQFLGTKETAEIRELIGWLYEPMKKMLGPIVENIKNGDYQLLIGDDASGRIPALIVRKFINNAYKHANRPAILTRFIAGSKTDGLMRRKDALNDERPSSSDFHSYIEMELLEKEKMEKVESYITNLKDTSPIHIDSAIVVTEFVETGDGLIPVMEGLHENNIASTLLTTSIERTDYGLDKTEAEAKEIERKEYYKKNLHLLAIYYGEDGKRPDIYKRTDLSGVFKHFADLHSTPVRSTIHHYSERSAYAKKHESDYWYDKAVDEGKKEEGLAFAKMGIARDEANRVAERLIAELLHPEAASTAAI